MSTATLPGPGPRGARRRSARSDRHGEGGAPGPRRARAGGNAAAGRGAVGALLVPARAIRARPPLGLHDHAGAASPAGRSSARSMTTPKTAPERGLPMRPRTARGATSRRTPRRVRRGRGRLGGGTARNEASCPPTAPPRVCTGTNLHPICARAPRNRLPSVSGRKLPRPAQRTHPAPPSVERVPAGTRARQDSESVTSSTTT